jgi:hypothetical protein
VRDPYDEDRHRLAKAILYRYRILRAYVRYYLKYTPDVLDGMSMAQLSEAFEDILYIREKERIN